MEAQESFGISAVARRTGMSAPNIRMWEKRYGAVTPERTSTNRRLYSAEDMERLALLRTLTERGHSISTIANLGLERLRARVAEDHPAPAGSPNLKNLSKRQRVLVAGSGLRAILSRGGILQVELAARFDDLETAAARSELPAADLVVIRTDTLFPETIPTIRDLVTRARCSRTILIYRYAASTTATALAKAVPGLSLLRSPVSDEQLRRECLVQLESLNPRNLGAAAVDSAPIPERLYTSDQLARLSRMSTSVACECPQHLADLLQSLSAFEKYSRECEDRNPQDALLHAFLHRTTAKVRRSMEEALQSVVQSEGIEL